MPQFQFRSECLYCEDAFLTIPFRKCSTAFTEEIRNEISFLSYDFLKINVV